jgi:hypothetical protein
MAHVSTVALLLLGATLAQAQGARPSPADSAAIRTTALNYIEGFYEANPERMESALHPELAKRIIYQIPGQPVRFESITAATLVERTRHAHVTPPANRQEDVTILDIFQNAASVKIVANQWVDYLHMVRTDGQWKILNVLWELKPRPAP